MPLLPLILFPRRAYGFGIPQVDRVLEGPEDVDVVFLRSILVRSFTPSSIMYTSCENRM